MHLLVCILRDNILENQKSAVSQVFYIMNSAKQFVLLVWNVWIVSTDIQFIVDLNLEKKFQLMLLSTWNNLQG